MTNVLEIAGDVSLFGWRAATNLFRRPFEGDQIWQQLAEVGSKSLPLIIASGFALGAVLTLHTRSTLVMFGAHEQVIDDSAALSMLRDLPQGAVGPRIAIYSQGYHMLLRDLNGDIVANDVAAWIADRKAPLPSGNECGGDAAASPPCRNR